MKSSLIPAAIITASPGAAIAAWLGIAGAAAAQTTIDMLHVENNPDAIALWEELAADYETANPGIDINLEFLEITFIVVPIFVPAMAALGFSYNDYIWFTVLMAINLNMAFISPPVGFSLFYLQSVAPPEVRTIDIHRGALPFMALQMFALIIVMAVPGIVTILL